jgi:hypothetical protein
MELKTTVTSDAVASRNKRVFKTEETIALAAQNRKKVETILVNGKFKVDSYEMQELIQQRIQRFHD